MADQVRRGVAWIYKNVASFGGDANRLYIGGHSSGGHLCGVTLVTDWQKEFGLPADIIKGGLCMSGMYDLKPVRLSKRSSYVKFTDEMEQAMRIGDDPALLLRKLYQAEAVEAGQRVGCLGYRGILCRLSEMRPVDNRNGVR